MSRKSASIRSFSSGAKICKKLAQPMRLPTPKERPVRNSKELGAMKSLTESPEGASQSHEKRNGSCAPSSAPTQPIISTPFWNGRTI
jgi:hypothetical protein